MNRTKFKESLNQLEPSERTALLYLEQLINKNHLSAVKVANETNKPKINTEFIDKKIQSNTKKISNLVSKYETVSTQRDFLLEKTKELYQIVLNLDDILRGHFCDINVATDSSRDLMERVLDLIAFAYSKDSKIGTLNASGHYNKNILTGNNKLSDPFPDVEPIVEQIIQLKQSLVSLGLQLKSDETPSVDTHEKRSTQ